MPEINFKHPRYRLIKPLGQGGLGSVWEAIDLEKDGPVAVKLLREDSLADRHLFEGEIRTLGELRHENIVRLLDAGARDGSLFLVMEHLRGRTLDRLLEKPGPDREQVESLLEITAQVLSALEYIHDRGIIHGDLKPSNIMVLETAEDSSSPEEKESPVIKLLDFGLARRSTRLTQGSLGEISSGRKEAEDGGTPLYMAPEQLAAIAVTERSDLYSLGALLYHIIAGRPPFETLNAALTRKPAPPSPDTVNDACDKKLARAIFAFMEEAPHKRPATATEAAIMLADAGSLSTREPPATPRIMRPVFIGRDRERGSILEKLDEVRRNKTLQALRIAGEGGSGKSWLLHASGLKTLAEFDSGARTMDTSFRQDRNGHGGLGRILLGDPDADYSPGLRMRFSADGRKETPPATATGEDHLKESNDQVIGEAAEGLRSLAKRQPLLVILEDIQYATEAEMDLLLRLVPALSDSPILLLLSYREEESRPGSNLEKFHHRLETAGHPQPLRLGGLDDNALKQYVESVLSPRLPASPELLETLAARSGGNPLALHRALSQLVSQGCLARDSGSWGYVKTTGFGKLKENPEALDSLDPQQRDVLMAARLINETFDLGLLSCLLEEEGDSGSIRAAAAGLVASGLLLESRGGYRPAPGLELDELLAAVPKKRSRGLHERLARLLVELNPSPGTGLHMRIARHLELADDREGAFEHYLAAARCGARDYSNQVSGKAYEKALEYAAGGSRQEILRELGALHLSCGNLQEALDCLLEVESGSGDHSVDDRVELWVGIARILHRQGKLEEAEDYFNRCLSIAGEEARALAKIHYGLAGLSFDRRNLTLARDHFQRSLELYGDEAQPRNLVPLHLGLALVERIENRPRQSITRFKKALELARQTGQLLDIARIQGNLANTYRALGDMSAALEHLEESTRIRKLTGDRQGLAICLNSLARIQTQRGEFQEALEATQAALETFEEIGDPKGISIALCNTGELLLLLGRPGEAKDILERCSRFDEKNEGTPLACNILFNLGRVELAVCQHEKAEELFRECLRRLPRGQEHELEAHALASLAEVFLQKEMLEAAEDALQEARGLPGSSEGESADELLGLRMRLCRQRGELEQVIDLSLSPDGNEVGRYETARRSLELGAAYRDLGPDWADKTEKYLGKSVSEFEKMGCPVETSEALGELSLYWQLTGEEEEALDLLRRAETILSADQLSPRRSHFMETFKTRLQ